MNVKAIVTGLLGLLLLATRAFADPPLAATEKTYRLLQTIVSQLHEVQTSIAPRDSVPTAALAKAQEQVRIAATHYCHALYAAQLTAAKDALTQHEQAQALHHLQAADKTLEQCAAPLPGEKPQKDPDALALAGAGARQ